MRRSAGARTRSWEPDREAQIQGENQGKDLWKTMKDTDNDTSRRLYRFKQRFCAAALAVLLAGTGLSLPQGGAAFAAGTQPAAQVTEAQETAGQQSGEQQAATQKTADSRAAEQKTVCKEEQQELRGVWIYYGEFKEMGLADQTESNFTQNAEKLFKKLSKDGINTVFFHVVPCNDAIYPSALLDWSKYMFSREPDYDPLEILIKQAHRYGISFHAWLNPYRKEMGKSFNPGKKTSVQRIVNIVGEIVENYDVDGIHFDDYFYPSNGQFARVPQKTRKRKVNQMVRRVYRKVKSIREDVVFGISPAGNIEYAESIGCDLKTWMTKDGYVDYIIPQIYWSDDYLLQGRKHRLYTERLSAWCKLNRGNTPMYIGLGLYMAGVRSSVDRGWSKRSNNLVSQIKKERKAGCKGFVLFSAGRMTGKTSKKEMRKLRKYLGVK